MLRARHSIASVLTIAVVLSAGAVRAFAADNCEAVLLDTRETYSNNSDTEMRNDFLRYYCDEKDHRVQEGNSSGTNIGFNIPINNLPTEWEGSQRDDSSSSSSYRTKICQTVKSSASIDQKLRIAMQSTSNAAIKAWNDCIRQPGVRFWASTDLETPYNLTLIAKFEPLEGSDETTWPVNNPPFTITPDSAAVCKAAQIKYLRKRELTSGEAHIDCTRRTEEGFRVTLTTLSARTIVVPALGEAGCSSSAEVVDALTRNMYPASYKVNDVVREQWLTDLNLKHNVSSVMAKIINHVQYREIVNGSVEANPAQLNTPMPFRNAYSWMVNAIYYTQFGRLSTDQEAEAFYAAMPATCTKDANEDDCHKTFVKLASELTSASDWAMLYSDGMVPVFGLEKDKRIIVSNVRYCPEVSDCKTNMAWCPE